MPILGMALLTQNRPRGRKQGFEIRAVRTVAIQTVLAHWRVLEQEWAAFVGMAGIANLIDAIGFQERRRGRAMGIVAINAGDLSFQQRHMRPLLKLGSLHLVTLKTGFVDRLSRRQAMRGEVRHRVVTIAAAHIVAVVNGVVPEDALTALMAGQALRVLLRNRRPALAGKADDRAEIGGFFNMVRTRPMAGFATLGFRAVARIEIKDLGMNGVRPVAGLLLMTGFARFLANVKTIVGRVYRRGGGG